MTDWIHDPFPGHDVNVVFARRMPLAVLVEALGALDREPLACGEGDGWVWAVHDMHNWETEDYDSVRYGDLCPRGVEIVVFVVDPCSAKAFAPEFAYYRDGRFVLGFSFESIGQRVGDNPDHLSEELLAANLIGPGARFEGRDDHERLVRTISDYFGLPSLSVASMAAASSGVVGE
ncbi:hypothetical protein [Streptomyces sp. NPDC047042]|uniref:hypothetical protein n=1 Tax=Streptomyces sp. NPDC047042 TaxID=3154807 RepID=UPI00340F5239